MRALMKRSDGFRGRSNHHPIPNPGGNTCACGWDEIRVRCGSGACRDCVDCLCVPVCCPSPRLQSRSLGNLGRRSVGRESREAPESRRRRLRTAYERLLAYAGIFASIDAKFRPRPSESKANPNNRTHTQPRFVFFWFRLHSTPCEACCWVPLAVLYCCIPPPPSHMRIPPPNARFFQAHPHNTPTQDKIGFPSHTHRRHADIPLPAPRYTNSFPRQSTFTPWPPPPHPHP